MKVILHIGAHRCATTTFQDYLRQNATRLREQGIGYWGPRRTRTGLLKGLIPGPGIFTGRDLTQRAVGRIRMQLNSSARRGIRALVISDENMMGSIRDNVDDGLLYGGVGERMARFDQAFGDRVSEVVVNIRAQDGFWASSLGYCVERGHSCPDADAIRGLATAPRRWRDVLTDIACAMPRARIRVLPFELFASRPDAQLRAMTGQEPPKTYAREWLNATPRLPELREQAGAPLLPAGEGRWMPFDARDQAALRDAYADDITWLRDGGDGLVELTPDPDKNRQGQTTGPDDLTRGRWHDQEQGRMAKAR